MARPIRIRDDRDAIVRARCLRFLEACGPECRFEFVSGNRYWLSLGIGLADLSTEALVRIALDTVGRFWRQKREVRRSRAAHANMFRRAA